MIQESKFLGGDMEHTHLVKGLDYALLQKVRSEIHYKEQESEPVEKSQPAAPAPETKERKPKVQPPPQPTQPVEEDSDELTFK